MKRINETQSVSAALYTSDTLIESCALISHYQGVVVEVANERDSTNALFEGTLVYFPGVTLKELKEVV